MITKKEVPYIKTIKGLFFFTVMFIYTAIALYICINNNQISKDIFNMLFGNFILAGIITLYIANMKAEILISVPDNINKNIVVNEEKVLNEVQQIDLTKIRLKEKIKEFIKYERVYFTKDSLRINYKDITNFIEDKNSEKFLDVLSLILVNNGVKKIDCLDGYLNYKEDNDIIATFFINGKIFVIYHISFDLNEVRLIKVLNEDEEIFGNKELMEEYLND